MHTNANTNDIIGAAALVTAPLMGLAIGAELNALSHHHHHGGGGLGLGGIIGLEAGLLGGGLFGGGGGFGFGW